MFIRRIIYTSDGYGSIDIRCMRFRYICYICPLNKSIAYRFRISQKCSFLSLFRCNSITISQCLRSQCHRSGKFCITVPSKYHGISFSLQSSGTGTYADTGKIRMCIISDRNSGTITERAKAQRHRSITVSFCFQSHSNLPFI